MVANSRLSLQPSPFKYAIKEELKKMEKVSFYQGGASRLKRLNVTFTGDGQVKVLLHTVGEFEKNFNKLTFANRARFVNFGEYLADTAEDQWDTVLAATAPPRTNAGFFLYIDEFYQQYVQEDAKDIMIEYTATEECIKSRNNATLDHCNRMQTMMQRVNRLPGIEPNIGGNKSKQLIFRSLPDKYKRSCLESGYVVVDETLVSIVRYKDQQKNFDASSHSKNLA